MNSSCPQCQSKAFKRNGYTRHGKQNHRCLDCGRQFSLELPESLQPAELLVLATIPGAAEAPIVYAEHLSKVGF